MTERNLRHKSVPVYDDDDSVEDEIDGKRNYDVMDKVNSSKYNSNLLVEMGGNDITLEYIQKNGFEHPIIIKNKDGLGISIV